MVLSCIPAGNPMGGQRHEGEKGRTSKRHVVKRRTKVFLYAGGPESLKRRKGQLRYREKETERVRHVLNFRHGDSLKRDNFDSKFNS